MPRLTSTEYLSIGDWLTDTWLNHQTYWLELSPADQWCLHDFFDPSVRRTKEARLQFRADATARDRSLPQRAGRALSRIRQVAERVPPAAPTVRTVPNGRRHRVHNIRVRAVVRPHPDAEALARIIVQMAIEMEKAKARKNADAP